MKKAIVLGSTLALAVGMGWVALTPAATALPSYYGTYDTTIRREQIVSCMRRAAANATFINQGSSTVVDLGPARNTASWLITSREQDALVEMIAKDAELARTSYVRRCYSKLNSLA